ncbi:hypothetical protein FT663_05148 [Candidozyma haemuli var. vulneris]|nr:hypothetical protein FT663_05148 [[Candida] haemuloni var. vulneris]KAF3994256.1 hypothetical protein FT662_00125 [[Candida] haemuloni var. vulneris]
MLKRGNGEDNPKELESNSDRMSKEASRRESWTHSQVPDLSFLSNNFSTDSIDASSLPETKTHSEISHSSLPSSRSPANRTFPLGGEHQSHQLSPAPNKRESNAGIASDGNFAQNSNQYFSNQDKMNGRSPAVRPKSVFLTGNLNATIQTDETRRNGQASLKRHSFHYSSKSGYPAQSNPLSGEAKTSRSRSNSPVRSRSPRRGSQSPVRGVAHGRGVSPTRAPFNFKSQDMPMTHSNSSNSSLVIKPAHRKGHRYKHSSVSMNLFQEPVPIADSSLYQELIPSSYPIPNWSETWASANASQRVKLTLALAHFLTAVVVFIAGTILGESAFSTLAHLVFYDSLGSFVIAFVNILSNFDAWKKPSVAYPFGLGRLEVLLGFALSTSLVMVGCDLISHFVEGVVVTLAVSGTADSTDHGAHHIHGHSDGSKSPFLYEIVVALVVIMTWITSTLFYDSNTISDMLSTKDEKRRKNQDGLGGYLNNLQERESSTNERIFKIVTTFLKNPMRLITLVYSTFLFVIPLLPHNLKEPLKVDVDEASTLFVASTLCYAGWKLVTTLGGILLISFPYTEYDYSVLKSSVTEQIMGLDIFKPAYSLNHLFITKVNYQLYIAGVKITMKGGSSDDESRMLFEVSRIFDNAMKAFEKDSKVEITIDIDRI